MASLRKAGSGPFGIGGVSYIVLPEGCKLQPIPESKDADGPRRKRGEFTFRDVASLVVYVQRQRNVSSLVYADGRRLIAVLNGHFPESEDVLGTGWGDHRAVFEPKWTTAWTAWTGFDDQWQTQEAFAEFLEERIPDIAEPDGALLMETATNLRLRMDVVYEKAVSLANDTVQLTYREDMQAAGTIKIPERFSLFLRPFEGADLVEIHARLRIAKPDAHGKVRFMFRLGERVQRVVDEAFDAMAEEVQRETDVPVLKGTPPNL